MNWTFYPIGGAMLLALPHIGATIGSPPHVESLQAVTALPAHLAGRFQEPAAFQQDETGRYYVFDRRAHTVYSVDAAMTDAQALVRIGQEEGHVLLPTAFDVVGPGEFAVADTPGTQDRVQIFSTASGRIAGFSLLSRSDPFVQFEGRALNGVGSLRATREHTLLLNLPQTGSLITEYDRFGHVQRSFGRLRDTGHQDDDLLHWALNSGLPVPLPDGGAYFVFQTGEPRFRRYDAKGTLVFDRAIQGRELDEWLQAQPTTWPRRTSANGRDIPVVRPLVRAAAADREGRLWVSFTLPYSYVYEEGEKVRTVQFRSAGMISPTSLYFGSDGRLLVTPGCYIFAP